jgi:hypothetical protein
MNTPYILIAVAALIALLAGVAFALKGKEKRPIDYKAFFYIGVVWVLFGFIWEGMSSFLIMGAVFAVIGLVHKGEWEKNSRPWRKLGDKEKRMKMILIGLLTFTLLTGIFVYLLQNKAAEVITEEPVACEADTDCLTPEEYAVRSGCPYESVCVEGACEVICPEVDGEVQ